MARGFVYLIAIVDWFSRRVLAWRLGAPDRDLARSFVTLSSAMKLAGAIEIAPIFRPLVGGRDQAN